MLCDSSFTYCYYVKVFLMQLKRCWRSWKSLWKEHAFIWNRDSDLFLWGILILCISSMSQYLDEEMFSGSLLFSGVALLTWIIKVLNLVKVLMIMSYYDHFLHLSTVCCYYQYWNNKPGKFCYLIRIWKEKLCCNILCNTRIHHSFVDICNLNN